jgi:hypothetical protein
MLPEILTGVGLAGVTVALVGALNVKRDLHLYAIGLIIAAFIDVGFALTQDHSFWVMIEIAGAVLFSAMAILSLVVSGRLVDSSVLASGAPPSCCCWVCAGMVSACLLGIRWGDRTDSRLQAFLQPFCCQPTLVVVIRS